MPRLFALLLGALFAALFAALIAWPASAFAQAPADLRIHGSNTIGERLAPALVEAWLREEGYARVARIETAFEEWRIVGERADGSRFEVELHAHGSGTAFAGLAEARADIGMSSRPVTPAEVARLAPTLGRLDDPAQEHVIALDGLAIIVHPGNPVAAMGVDALRDVFSGRVRDWSQVGGPAGPIRLHARDERSGTWDSFRAMVLGDVPLSPAARRYESTAALAAEVAADPAAIGVVGLSGVVGVRALPVADGALALAPERFQVAVEDYPLARRLYLYTPAAATPAARRFVEFALGDAAQAEVEAVGFVSQRVDAWPARPRDGLPGEAYAMMEGARRLSLNFRFGSAASLLDAKAQRDLDRVAAFLRQRMAGPGAPELLLFGYADTGETQPYFAMTLSSDRVDYIAAELARRGVAVSRVRGLGAVAPVTADRGPRGQARNRRVEVWLR